MLQQILPSTFGLEIIFFELYDKYAQHSEHWTIRQKMLPFENLQFILRLVADKDQVACDKLLSEAKLCFARLGPT